MRALVNRVMALGTICCWPPSRRKSVLLIFSVVFVTMVTTIFTILADIETKQVLLVQGLTNGGGGGRMEIEEPQTSYKKQQQQKQQQILTKRHPRQGGYDEEEGEGDDDDDDDEEKDAEDEDLNEAEEDENEEDEENEDEDEDEEVEEEEERGEINSNDNDRLGRQFKMADFDNAQNLTFSKLKLNDEQQAMVDANLVRDEYHHIYEEENRQADIEANAEKNVVRQDTDSAAVVNLDVHLVHVAADKGANSSSKQIETQIPPVGAGGLPLPATQMQQPAPAAPGLVVRNTYGVALIEKGVFWTSQADSLVPPGALLLYNYSHDNNNINNTNTNSTQ